MPIYISRGRFTSDAVKGMVAKPENREEAVSKLFESVGGRLIGWYLTFGPRDWLAIAEFPNEKAAASAILAAAAGGSLSDIETTLAMTAKDAHATFESAAKAAKAFRSAGRAQVWGKWDRLAPELANLRMVTNLDRAALAAYCSAYAPWAEANEAIQKYGAMIKSPSGYPVQSPHVAIANRQTEIMIRIVSEFGFTPASRSRILAPLTSEATLFDMVDEPTESTTGQRKVSIHKFYDAFGPLWCALPEFDSALHRQAIELKDDIGAVCEATIERASPN